MCFMNARDCSRLMFTLLLSEWRMRWGDVASGSRSSLLCHCSPNTLPPLLHASPPLHLWVQRRERWAWGGGGMLAWPFLFCLKWLNVLSSPWDGYMIWGLATFLSYPPIQADLSLTYLQNIAWEFSKELWEFWRYFGNQILQLVQELHRGKEVNSLSQWIHVMREGITEGESGDDRDVSASGASYAVSSCKHGAKYDELGCL